MKDKCFIYYGNPCSNCLSDPEVKSFEDAMRQAVVECPYAADHCSVFATALRLCTSGRRQDGPSGHSVLHGGQRGHPGAGP